MGIFLEMYSIWDFWTKETGLALKTSVFSTETTLDSMFHLLAYQNFHKLFYEWETTSEGVEIETQTVTWVPQE